MSEKINAELRKSGGVWTATAEVLHQQDLKNRTNEVKDSTIPYGKEPTAQPEVLEHVDLGTLRLLNESAVHAHALECSKRNRAGKFTRVGSDFMDEVKADVEVLIREIRNKGINTLHETIETGEIGFVTGAMLERIKVELNRAIGRMIQNKVQRHPTTGKTLGRTR